MCHGWVSGDGYPDAVADGVWRPPSRAQALAVADRLFSEDLLFDAPLAEAAA